MQNDSSFMAAEAFVFRFVISAIAIKFEARTFQKSADYSSTITEYQFLTPVDTLLDHHRVLATGLDFIIEQVPKIGVELIK